MAQIIACTGLRANLLTGMCIDNVGLASPVIVRCVLAVVGASVCVWCYQVLGWLFMFKLLLLPHHKLVMSGPCTTVRHPSCTGMILILSGTSLVHRAQGALMHKCPMVYYLWTIFWWLLITVLCAVMVDRCNREDNMLHSTFGREWEAWSGQVWW